MISSKKALLIFCCVLCSELIAQRGIIDSLRRMLPALSSQGRIDCLNALYRPYSSLRNDSARYFVELALQEATQANYIHGIAEATANQAGIEVFFSEDFPKGEQLAAKALKLFDASFDKRNISEAYYNLAYAQYAQSSFNDALKNLNESYQWAQKQDDPFGMYQSLSISSEVYRESGDYKLAFEFAQKSLPLILKLQYTNFEIIQYLRIGDLYRDIEDYQTGLAYYRNAAKLVNNENQDFFDYPEFAELLCQANQLDSANYYFTLADTLKQRNLRLYLTSIGSYYFLTGNYQKALNSLNRALEFHLKFNDMNLVMQCYLDLARTYGALGSGKLAKQFAYSVLKMAKDSKAHQFVRDAYKILSGIYDKQHNVDSAYYFFKNYIELNDEIISDHVKGKLVAYSFEQQIELLNKENELKQTRVEQQTTLNYFFAGGIVTSMLVMLVFFRNVSLKRKREKDKLLHKIVLQHSENERVKAELTNQKNELQMRALRAQMNPHFIFNSLNSINRFILENERARAMEYLTKFSKLIRLVLENSQSPLVSLESELDALRIYLELESLHFNQEFSFSINVASTLNCSDIMIPPLIIQPYTENAIWHGLLHKNQHGILEINVNDQGNQLMLQIRDDGVGREQSQKLKEKTNRKHESLGLKITSQRIALLDHADAPKSEVIIQDLTHPEGGSSGTEVIIKIPKLQANRYQSQPS